MIWLGSATRSETDTLSLRPKTARRVPAHFALAGAIIPLTKEYRNWHKLAENSSESGVIVLFRSQIRPDCKSRFLFFGKELPYILETPRKDSRGMVRPDKNRT